MVRGNDRQHGIFEIKRLEPLFAQIQTYDWGRVGGSEKNKFINHKLGLEVRVGRQSVITKHDCQQLPFQQSWWKKTSNSPALYSSTFCYLAQGIVIFFSYIYKIKRWWGPITLQGNAGRVINVGLESFTSNQNLKFPVMCRWQEGSRRLLVMEQGQFLFGGVLTILGCHALIPCFLIILSRGQAGPKHGPMRRDRSRLLGWRWALRKQSLQVNNDTSLYLHNASKFTKCFHVQYFTECSNNSILLSSFLVLLQVTSVEPGSPPSANLGNPVTLLLALLTVCPIFIPSSYRQCGMIWLLGMTMCPALGRED